MNVFAKFDEIPSMILQDIKETKLYGHKNVSDKKTLSDTQTDVKTVYPPTNTVCWGYKNAPGRELKRSADGRTDVRSNKTVFMWLRFRILDTYVVICLCVA